PPGDSLQVPSHISTATGNGKVSLRLIDRQPTPNAAPQPRPEAAATQERSNCLGCQGCLVYFSFWTSWACQDGRCFSMALSIVPNLCLHAVRATFLRFPAASSR